MLGFPLPPQPQTNPALPGASRALLSWESRLSPRARLSPSVPNTEPTPRSGPRCELVKAQPPGVGRRHPAQGAAPSSYSQLLFLGTKVGVRGKDGFIGQKEEVFSRGCWLGVTTLSSSPCSQGSPGIASSSLPSSPGRVGPSWAHPIPPGWRLGKVPKGGMPLLPPHLPLQGVESLCGNHGNPPLPLWEHS